MSGSYFQPIKREFLNLSGGTVTGDTLFTTSLSATSFYLGGTPLEEVIANIASNTSGVTGNYLHISGGTGGPYEFIGNTTADTIFVSTVVEPMITDVVDIGTPFKRFRDLNIVNGIAVNFTANTMSVSTAIEPMVTNFVDIGTPIKRFRNLNIVNGITVNFTAETRVSTIELKLGNTVVTEDNIVLTGNTLEGGYW